MPKNKKASSSSNSSSNNNNNKRSYDEALSALTGVLSAREKDLDEREKQMEKEKLEIPSRNPWEKIAMLKIQILADFTILFLR